QQRETAVEKVARDGGGVVAIGGGGAGERPVVRQLHQRVVAELVGIAKVGERVFGRAVSELLGRVLIEQARLADVVQADVGQRDVLFQHRAVSGPFGVALA